MRILGNTSVTANFVPTGTGGSGTILREYWLNVTGGTVSSLTGNANYPNSPTGSGPLTSFEGPTNTADNYGSRVRGYVHPPITGAYTFWIASDDASDLLLSTNDSPANATRIAFVSEWTDSRQWTKFPSQRSASINLVGGQRYYIEAIQKEATGGDNLAVSWQGPGMAQAVIPGNFLSPFVARTGGHRSRCRSRRPAPARAPSLRRPTGVNCGATCSCELHQRRISDADGRGGQWFDVHRLERRVHGHIHLHGVDDAGAFRDRDVHQPGDHVRTDRHA